MGKNCKVISIFGFSHETLSCCGASGSVHVF